MAVNGSYGDNGTEYRTENGNGVRVFSYGQTGTSHSVPGFVFYRDSGPEKFIVHARDGSQSEYGYTDDSRIERIGGSGVKDWLINKSTDQFTNYITYSYNEDNVNGDVNIARIDYAGNTDNTILPNSSVRFSYEGRYDTYPSYNSGSKYQTLKRLRKIETYLNTTKLLTYNFYYKNVNNEIVKKTYLTSIEKCNTSACLNSLNIDWQETPGVTGIESILGLCADGSTAYTKCNDQNNFVHIRYPDINADGFSDVCYRGDYGIACHISDGVGGYTYVPTSMCGDGQVYEDCDYGVPDSENFSTISYVDANGDGMLDIVFRGDMGLEAHVWNGSGFTPHITKSNICSNGNSCDSDNIPYIHFADINADGFADFCYRGDTGISCRLGSANGWGAEKVSDICANGSGLYGGCNDNDNWATISYVDMTGDGVLELVYRSDSGMRVAFWSSSGFVGGDNGVTTCASGQAGCNDMDNYSYIRHPDINGDGLSDLCYRGDSGIRCHFANGDNWNASADIVTDICGTNSGKYGQCNDSDNYTTIQYTDFNADGLSDLVFRSDNEGIKVFLYDGATFSEHADSTLNGLCSTGSVLGYICNDQNNYNTISFADFNGDGESDFVYRSDVKGIITYIQNDYKQPLVTKITDSFGIEQSVKYSSLTDKNIHTKGSSANYPQQDIQFPQYVVSEKVTTDGLSGTTKTTYRYEGARIDRQGRGQLGFAKTISTNTQTNLVTAVNYYQAYPFTSMVKNETQVLNGKVLSYTSNIPASFSLGNNRELVYVATKHVEAYDLNGLHISTVTTVNEINGNPNGDITDVTVTTQDETNTTETYSTITHNNYLDSDLGDFNRESLVTSSTVKKISPLGASPTVTQNLLYTNKYKILSESGSVNDGAEHTGITKTYGYDSFGHINSTTITAPDIETRVVTTEYDARGQFALNVTNEMGHEVNTTYDARYGAPLTKTDANGLVTTYQYDNWGEVTDVYAPGGNTTHTDKSWCQVNCILPAINTSVAAQLAKFSSTTSVAGGGSLIKYASDVTTYYDKLGREIRKQTTNFKNETVLVDTAYDDLGRVVAQTQPYFIGDDKNETNNTYDTLSRIVSSVVPGEGTTTVTYNDAQFKSTSTRVANNPVTGIVDTQISSETKNVIGQVQSNTDTDGNVLFYEYDAQGNKIKTLMPSVSADGSAVADLKGTVITIAYDVFGRKESMDDPNMGHWSYTYDSTSKLRTQTDALGQVTSMNYDRLGRMVDRTDNDGRKTFWAYNDDKVAGDTPDTMSVGKLDVVYQQDSTGFEEYRQSINYTADLGLIDFTSTTIEEGDVTNSNRVIYVTQSQYDEFHRPETVSYPETSTGKQLQLKYVYTNGTLTEVNKEDGTLSYWQAKDVNAKGDITLASYGVSSVNPSGVISQARGHDVAGRLTFLDYAHGLSTLYNASYQYNGLGSLVSRESLRDNTINSRDEKYYYDSLQRLTSVEINGITDAKEFTYDVLGNIRSKNNLGTYEYNGAKPHAVSRVNNVDYIYNANGAIVTGGNRTVSWTAFNKPASITKNGVGYSTFNYGPSRARYRQYSYDNSDATKAATTIYVGGSYEKVTENGVTKHKHYIKVGGKTIAQHTVTQTVSDTVGVEKLEYLLRDNQGSSVAVIDASGSVAAQMDYDAFGARRPVLGSSLITSVVNDIPRGYTGHEHLTNLGLIHMNGRVYDPLLGRFLSADPIIQFSKNIQSYNRFSYVLNNPMSYTDPSGFSLRKLFKRAGRFAARVFVLGSDVLAVIAYSKPVRKAMLKYKWLRLAGSTLSAISPMTASAYSAYITDISGGSFGDVVRSAGISAATAWGFNEVGDFFGKPITVFAKIGKVLAHGTVGGLSSVASGGKFKDGFIGAALSQALSVTDAYELIGITPKTHGLIRGAAAAVVGGIVSSASGGSFESGAISALYGMMFNDVKHTSGERRAFLGSQKKGLNDVEEMLAMMNYLGVDGLAEFAMYDGRYSNLKNIDIYEKTWKMLNADKAGFLAEGSLSVAIKITKIAVTRSFGLVTSSASYSSSVLNDYIYGDDRIKINKLSNERLLKLYVNTAKKYSPL